MEGGRIMGVEGEKQGLYGEKPVGGVEGWISQQSHTLDFIPS